jgi:hypothetical protein
VAILEQWVLDGLALNDNTVLRLESITDTPAAKRPEWVSGAETDGEILGRPPKYANKVIEMRLRVVQQATADLAIAKIALVLNKLQECEQNANGLALVWTPADTTTSPITWRCLLGEITDLPKDLEGAGAGFFDRSPAFTVRLTCLPLGEGTEVLAGTVTSSDIMATLTLTGVAGDVPALGRLVVTEAASQSRRWVAWGLESRWLPTSSAPSLIVDSTSMVTSGYAGATATRTGAYNGASNNVISATLRTQVQAICGLGNLTHVGQFRPQLRFYASATTMAVRLTWQALDGPFGSLSYKVPVVAGWNHVDLGSVSIPSTALGTQKWTGRIEAYSTATGGETFQVDVVCMIPGELFGRARGTYNYSPGPVVAYDDFTGMTATTALNAAVSDGGQTWATSGATTDFTAADAPAATDETVVRTTTSETGVGRFAVLGSTNYTDVEVGARIYTTNVGADQAIGARYVDANNHFDVVYEADQYGARFWVEQTVASTKTYLTDLVRIGGAQPTALWRRLRLVVYASGRGIADLLDDNGAILHRHMIFSTALATGGALATGKPFLRDQYVGPAAGPQARYYDAFAVAIPAPEPIALYSGQSIEFRSNTTLREDSTGTYAGPPPEYVGSRFFVPPAGGPARKTRIAVMAKRSDVETTGDDYIADSQTVDAYVTPRYLAIPR